MVTKNRRCVEGSEDGSLYPSRPRVFMGISCKSEPEEGGALRAGNKMSVTASVIFTQLAALNIQEFLQLGPSGCRAAKRLDCDVCGLQRDCTNVIVHWPKKLT